MALQIFGTKKCKNSRKAERFFKERRVPFHFVDIKVKPPSPGELVSIASAVGWEEMLDKESKGYSEGGYSYRIRVEEDIPDNLIDNPGLLKTPVVRMGREACTGFAPGKWKEFADKS
ncbi:MAG: arsenate reductase family protein [Fibrobacterota bacterium]